MVKNHDFRKLCDYYVTSICRKNLIHFPNELLKLVLDFVPFYEIEFSETYKSIAYEIVDIRKTAKIKTHTVLNDIYIL